MVDIFEYLNYRLYLQDLFSEKKKKDKTFTHRKILKSMGVSSTGFLSNIISGKKNINTKHILSLCEALSLKQNERICFDYLVHYNQARSFEEKKICFDKLVSLKKIKMRLLSKKQLSLFSRWYYVYIRDILHFYPFTGDYNALAKKLQPSITEAQAKQAIAYLLEVGLIAKTKQGLYKPLDATISTGDEVHSVELASFQLKTMDMAKQALQKVPGSERDISVLSLTVSDVSFQKMKQEISDFRKKLLKIALEESVPDQVFQCNIQFFPVSKKESRGTEND